MPCKTDTKNEERTLTLNEVRSLHWKDLDVEELDSRLDSVWETVHKLREAQVVSAETLASEIGV